MYTTLQLRHNERDGVSHHQRLDCLFNRLFRPISKKKSKLRVTGIFRGIHRWPVNSPQKGPVTRKMFPFDDVIMKTNWRSAQSFLSIIKTHMWKQIVFINGNMQQFHEKCINVYFASRVINRFVNFRWAFILVLNCWSALSWRYCRIHSLTPSDAYMRQ